MFLSGKAGRDVLKGGAGDDTLYGFGGDDSLSGGGGQDVLAGNEGNDTLSGGTGDDYLLGGLGNDVIDGGAGVDWAAYEDATAAVKVDLNLTAAQATGGAGSDKLTGIENLYGSAYGDTLIGNAGVNYLSGGAGNDRLEGGAGDDHLEGGRGSDTIIGGDGWDVVSYDDSPVGVNVSLSGGWGDDISVFPNPSGDRDRLEGIEAVYGSRFVDHIFGSSGDDYLAGNDGNDGLYAGSGNDVADGGAGDDYLTTSDGYGHVDLLGGDGFDTVRFACEQGVTVDMGAIGAQTAQSGVTFSLSSIEKVVGTNNNDTFYASERADVFDGSAGSDMFVYRSLAEIGFGETSDTIIMYSGTSTIDLSRIDADVTKAGKQSFSLFMGQVGQNTAFTGHAGEISAKYDVYNLKAWLEFDVNGDKVADAVLHIPFNMNASDFIL